MDFDHVRGKKHANVMELIPTLSKKKIDEEIAKCEIVCSNCHRARTHSRKIVNLRKEDNWPIVSCETLRVSSTSAALFSGALFISHYI